MIKEAFILNYDCGNFSSLRSWLNKANIQTYLIDDAEEFEQLNESTLLILPGVGHFKTAYDAITRKRFREPLESIRSTVPILGICLGAQIMFESSEEAPTSRGLGWFNGHIKKLPTNQCPRLGWYETMNFFISDQKEIKRKNEDFFYYNHSYFIDGDLTALNDFKFYSKSSSNILADYVSKSRIMGIQYHPEKSQISGSQLLNWILVNL